MEQEFALQQARLNLFGVIERMKSVDELYELQLVISNYYAQKATDAMDKLWETGEWSAEKNEALLNAHLRTPYRYVKHG